MKRKLCRQLVKCVLLLAPALGFSHNLASENAGSNSTQGVITPAVGPLPNNSVDVVVDAEFLWWFGQITDLSYALKGQTIPLGDNLNPNQISQWVPSTKQEFDWSWDPGCRVGLGVITNYDGWDVYSDWTYFYNSLADSSSVPVFDNSDLTSLALQPGIEALTSSWFINPNNDFLQRISSRLSLQFNQIDLQLGRKYWISHRLSLHPIAGLRGYWASMHFDVKGSRPLRPAATFFETASQFKQKSWAVGLLTGLNGSWHFTRNWSLFTDLALALTYGKYWVKRESSQFEVDQNNVVLSNISATTRNTIYQTQPFVDLALGFRWEEVFNQSIRLMVDAGWEFHFLTDFNHLFRGTEPSISRTALPSASGDLTLSGLAIRGRIEF